MWSAARLLTIGITSLLLTSGSPMTGSVSGQLTLMERPGAPTRDLAAAIVYLESLDARGADEPGTVTTAATINMRGREFVPRVAVVRAGGSVAFPNQDPFSHNVFSNTDPVSFDLGLYRRGATRSTTFPRSGVYPVYCNIHARMVSYVVAVPGRHVAFADAQGHFTVTDVPVGLYRVHVWHERATHAAQDVAVTAAGATVRIELDARGYIPGPHLNKFGMPYSSTRGDRY